ncbi:MAG: TIGR02996 domain-containing protein [Kofleriaceae bacterium]
MARTKRRPVRVAAKQRAQLAEQRELEEAIFAAPLDPVPRMVYGDWLQTAGDRRGEWVSLATGIEADPANVRLRAAAVTFLERHATALLDIGASLLPGMWLGWRGGFIDEIRLQPVAVSRRLRCIEALFRHPSARFVRTVAIGQMGPTRPVLDALAAANLRLLEALVLEDQTNQHDGETVRLDGFPALRRLGLRRVTVEGPIPPLVELACDAAKLAQLACPTLEELVVDLGRLPVPNLVTLFARLPAIRRLRLIQATDEAYLRAALDIAPRLELLELSQADLSGVADRLLALPRSLQLRATHVVLPESIADRLRARGATIATVTGPVRLAHDWSSGPSWLGHLLDSDGRDALRLIPGAGHAIGYAGIQLVRTGANHDGARLLDAAVTLPSEQGVKTWQAAAIAHERLLHFDDAELVGREALLRDPKEPNCFAIIIDALRRSGRLDEALALVPRALEVVLPWAMHSEPCLLDCLFTLAQAGRHDEVLALAELHRPHLSVDMRAVVVMSHYAAGNAEKAKAMREHLAIAMQRHTLRKPVHDHLAAVVAMQSRKGNRIDMALAALELARDARYAEWHWIAKDPNLAALQGHPRFTALLA